MRLRTTKRMEWLKGKMRRQEREMQMLPNADSAFRLVGALLAEPHEMWGIGKRDYDLAECCEWKIPQTQEVP
jgi:transposase-like protein